MKKRMIAAALLLCMLLTLCACKGKEPEEESTEPTGKSVLVDVQETSEDVVSIGNAPLTEEATDAEPVSDATETAAPTEAPSTAAPTTTAAPKTTVATTAAPTTTAAPATTAAAAKNVDLNALSSQIISKVGVEGAMPVAKDQLTDLYGIAQSDIASSGCFITVNGSFPEEAVMIEASSAAAKSRIVSALNTRLSDVLVQAENYDPENYALAQQCKVISSGNYVALFVSPSHAAMESAFQSAVG